MPLGRMRDLVASASPLLMAIAACRPVWLYGGTQWSRGLFVLDALLGSLGSLHRTGGSGGFAEICSMRLNFSVLWENFSIMDWIAVALCVAALLVARVFFSLPRRLFTHKPSKPAKRAKPCKAMVVIGSGTVELESRSFSPSRRPHFRDAPPAHQSRQFQISPSPLRHVRLRQDQRVQGPRV